MMSPATGGECAEGPGPAARVLDGRAIAGELAATLGERAAELRRRGTVPALAMVGAGDDRAARSYLRVLERGAARVGVELRSHRLDPDPGELAARLEELNTDRSVHGVVLQSPLPAGLDRAELASRIAPAKDVDGAGPASAARLLLGRPGFVPAAAAAVMEILRSGGVELSGARAVVLGRSMVVGRPTALLLLAADATVTVAHSRTRDLAALTRQADVLVVAVGRPRLVGAGFVKPGATVIDVGTNPTADGVVGDVDFGAVAPLAGAITPVPGGVGPVTTMSLLRQTISAATRQT
jgi:methylenetetrahydrofolate dehydrogenase (NADP+) / methenyltetrahydrofolate cyclohydrolase